MKIQSALAALIVLGASTAACRAQGAPLPATALPSSARAVAPPTQDYLVFVASEAVDRIALVRFGPGGARVEREVKIGTNPTEPVGPHGLGVSPDGKYYYVSTAHGFPNGRLWKFTTAGDSAKGSVALGAFPATLQVSPNGAFAYVVNFNLHGDMKPSSVSMVYLDDMVEVARIPTCTMPHGSRFTADGTKHYSACMMDDVLIEIDTRSIGIARHFMLGKGSEHGMAGPPGEHGGTSGSMSGGGAGGHGMAAPSAGDNGCSPTWAQPTPDGTTVFVACSKSSDIAEIDARTWMLRRRIPAGAGVYNLALTGDDKLLVATNKRGQSVSIIDVASGKELARLATKRRVPSGVTISSDDRYAFVTVEGVGAEPGTVEIIDLRALTTVATVDVGQMAGGIDFWKSEPKRD